jgi:hypothetical protein
MDAPADRVRLRKWNAVALWSFSGDGAVENCAICLNALVDRCIDCTVDLADSESCVIVWGMCSKLKGRVRGSRTREVTV